MWHKKISCVYVARSARNNIRQRAYRNKTNINLPISKQAKERLEKRQSRETWETTISPFRNRRKRDLTKRTSISPFRNRRRRDLRKRVAWKRESEAHMVAKAPTVLRKTCSSENGEANPLWWRRRRRSWGRHVAWKRGSEALMVAKAPTVLRQTCSLENGEAKPGRLLSW